MERRTAFDENPESFCKQREEESQALVKKTEKAIEILCQDIVVDVKDIRKHHRCIGNA